jgi:hypothetical protein
MKIRFFFRLLLITFLPALPLPLFAAASAPLEVPGFTAYSEPNPEALEIPESGPVKGWSDANTTLAWYGLVRTPGKLNISVRLHLSPGQQSRLRMAVDGHALSAGAVHGTDGAVTVSFGSVHIKSTGGHRFALSGLKKSGQEFGEIDSLMLDGPAIKDALFNLTPQRGAPSVHLNFPIPDGVQAKWFYNEVTVKKDPIWSYYEACGFARGYFGIQVNSPTERRIIFSVWDAGKEPTDRSKVAPEDRVQLLAKEPGVIASDFGNEGTGGHSHLVYPGRPGRPIVFL